MRPSAVALLASLALCAGCGGPAATTAMSSPRSPVAAPTDAPPHFDAYVGAYRSDAGVTYGVNGHGHIARFSDGWFRQMFPTPVEGVFKVGPGFQVQTPAEAVVTFHMSGHRADQLTIAPVSGPPVTARRLAFKETDTHVQAAGAVLAATITEPVGPGPHPAIVIVHGSGIGPRIDYGIWVDLFASLDLNVLAYDKRGNGDSTGTYPGEVATAESLSIYADDAAACLRFLTAWPGVDPRRVGFYGGSQGGWVVPLAMQRSPVAAFAVLLSGPAVTTGQQRAWADDTANSRIVPTAAPADIDTGLRADHSGYDPAPVLAMITAPLLWINGDADLQVPTRLNTEVLHSLAKPNFDVQVLTGVAHSMLENATGLTADDSVAQRLARDLFRRIESWLSAHVTGAT